jgi:hypothetical protein
LGCGLHASGQSAQAFEQCGNGYLGQKVGRDVQRWLVVLLTVAVLAAGCAGPSKHVANPPASSTLTSAPTGASPTPEPVARKIMGAGALEPLTDVLPVSVPGHRTSEFTVARDPTNHLHLVAAGMDWDSADGTVQCAAFVSTDGGHDWSAVQGLPGHTSTSEDTDPWVAIDDRGVVYLTCTEAGTGLLLGQSNDGGFTWQTATVVPTGGVAAKDSLGAFNDGELYLCYQQGDLQVLHSKDHGATWVQKGFPRKAGCNGIVRGPDGTIYVIYQGGGAIEADRPSPPPPILGLVFTHDGALSWSDTLIQQDLGTAPANMQTLPQAAAPSLAVSNLTGTVFVAAQQFQNAEAAGPVATDSRSEALLVRSRDGGATFTPLELPKVGSESCIDCHVAHPTLTVDDGGRLIAQFTLSDGQSLHKETWVTASSNEGDDWVDPLLLAATDVDQSYASAGNLLPDPSGIANDVGDIASNPGSAPGAAQAQASHVTWSVTHRDGGEYFGISSTPEGIVDLWDQHDADGKNQITGRIVAILPP